MAKRKRAPLVSQYLENVSSAALEDYQDLFRDYAKQRHGVYALYKGKRLYYVGLAQNLRNRLKQHLRDRHRSAWDRFSMYLTLDDAHIKELESLVLRIVRPEGNRQIGKFGRAENLQRSFARTVREATKERINDMLGRSAAKPASRRAAVRESTQQAAVLRRYITQRTALRATYKGKPIRARVLENGTIICVGKRFRSPSHAARAACPGRGAVNGWHFWKYERSPGDWVLLDNLRRP